MQLKRLSEQVVVVMGASSGIGRAAALRLADAGASVVVAARSEVGLASLVEEIAGAGGTATSVRADVTDAGQVAAVAEHAVSHHGRIDTWVQVAGVLLVAPFSETDPAEFARVLQVNLMGQVHGAKAALPHLAAAGGAFLSISSMGAKRAIPLQTAYCASKHGVDAFLEAWRTELEHDGVPISVTEIMPATINTPLFDNARTKIGVKPTAPPPAYPPSAVADAVVFAAQHPVPRLVVGGAARAIITTQALAPRLLDVAFRRFGYQLHNTGEPKARTAADNLDAPVPGRNDVEGTIGRFTVRHSLYTWWSVRRPRFARRGPVHPRTPAATSAS
jgi:NAD(P)-dependent dehydrogenase (short-subunit alcohol dehydrogenase family)